MKITREERIRRALEDLETIELCKLIADKEVMYPIHEEVMDIFKEAQRKRGYVPGFYRIQLQETGYISEEDL